MELFSTNKEASKIIVVNLELKKILEEQRKIQSRLRLGKASDGDIKRNQEINEKIQEIREYLKDKGLYNLSSFNKLMETKEFNI